MENVFKLSHPRFVLLFLLSSFCVSSLINIVIRVQRKSVLQLAIQASFIQHVLAQMSYLLDDEQGC